MTTETTPRVLPEWVPPPLLRFLVNPHVQEQLGALAGLLGPDATVIDVIRASVEAKARLREDTP